MPTVRQPSRCPCGSREAFERCCGALHRGREVGTPSAPTAERLMRSRFSAFAVGDRDYLLATWHRSTRPTSLELDAGVEWRQLEILGTTAGSDHDAEGTVEFAAYYWDLARRQLGQQREHSAFVCEAGQWFYVGPVIDE